MFPKVHLHFRVRDLAASREFYRRFFGCEPVKNLPAYAKFLPDLGPVNLALTPGGAGTPDVVDHLGIQVDDPGIVRRELARVRATGLPVREEMDVDCCHANQDKFWVTDPDGVEWEVYHLNRDLDPTDGSGGTGACACSASGPQNAERSTQNAPVPPAAGCCGGSAP